MNRPVTSDWSSEECSEPNKTLYEPVVGDITEDLDLVNREAPVFIERKLVCRHTVNPAGEQSSWHRPDRLDEPLLVAHK
ncbi:hypothetical protein T265_12154 [Opisthorchis viverrini]|uniref:Uncharacterized protein n=1 Tax=Opisthorchis viverrini TaxID=6198 RepID=A0A074YVU2_OPIVI|nr:hypothetical protein T265_12154 [Opisthorchis viverrini]KER18793.1 hypothetical protein T265_12154 [Opisthorchis viverrini]